MVLVTRPIINRVVTSLDSGESTSDVSMITSGYISQIVTVICEIVMNT